MSSGGKRWIVPKGRIEQGQTAGEAALLEAWEEAGLVGSLRPGPVGSYIYEKCGRMCHVTVFLMEVTGLSDAWPECHRRSRRWVRPERAAVHLNPRGLRKLLRKALVAVPTGLPV
jgi:8-oxo-dGTP pyrophosphatase MutT (NUDIX family)